MSIADASPVFCAYCGLPTANAEPAFCCYGCRFAASVAGSDGEGGADARWMFTRLGLAIFCTMNVLAFTMALWSGDIYGPDGVAVSPTARALEALFRYLCLLFALPVVYFLGLPLAENAWQSLKCWRLNTDLLLVAGVTAALLASVYSVLRDDGPIYFEVACMILVLVTLGRWLEATAKARATQGLETLEKLLPHTVHVIVEQRETEKPLRQLEIRDIVRVRAGERIPCDGRLLGRAASVDEQLLTGECTPCTKEPGAAVCAGTLNLDADLLLSVESLPEKSTLARLVQLLRQARQSKGRHEQLADRLAAWFLPIVALIAVGAALWHGSTRGPAEGVLTGLAVLLIACPCALGIATPLAVWSAFTLAIRHGVLFRHGEALERLAATQHFCFDKTGTLTTGTPQVSDRYLDADAAEIRIRAATLASASRHVFSRAVARAIGVPALASIAVQTVPGRGVRARWPEEACDTALGSERWMRELGVVEPDAVAAWVNERPGPAIVLLAWGGCVRAVFALGEQLRPEARAVVAELKVNHGVTVLTGDQPASAERWRQQLEVEVRAGLLPEKKLAALQELREQGRRVAMVGDGINDSPALAASDVGIALGCGADIARDNADVCLLDDDLRKIPWALRLSRHTVRIVRQNLFWAFLYNTIGIGLACAGYLNPVLAALAMVASSLFVLVNSLRVQHLTFSEEARP